MSGSQSLVTKNAGEGKIFSIAGDVYTFTATGEDTSGEYALIEGIVSPNGGPPPHYHTREVESFYVLKGEEEFYAEGKVIKGVEGTFIQMPKGVIHSFKNVTTKPAKMLIIVVPSGLEKYFEEVGHPMESLDDPIPPMTKEDMEKIVSAAPRYGMEILPPGD